MKKLFRNPDITWRVESHREAHVKEILEDPSRESEDGDAQSTGTITLLDGGVVYQLNLLGAEVWKFCDGSLDRKGITTRLMDLFEVDQSTLTEDVSAFLDEMVGMGLIHER